MMPERDTHIFELDTLHWKMLLGFGAIVVAVVSFWIGLFVYEFRRSQADRQRIATLEGQMHTVLESLQHAGE